MRVVVESHSDREGLQIGVGIDGEVVGDDGLGRSSVGEAILRRCECLRDSGVDEELLRQGIEAIEERVSAVIDADRADSRCSRVVGCDDTQFGVWTLERKCVLEVVGSEAGSLGSDVEVFSLVVEYAGDRHGLEIVGFLSISEGESVAEVSESYHGVGLAEGDHWRETFAVAFGVAYLAEVG